VVASLPEKAIATSAPIYLRKRKASVTEPAPVNMLVPNDYLPGEDDIDPELLETTNDYLPGEDDIDPELLETTNDYLPGEDDIDPELLETTNDHLPGEDDIDLFTAEVPAGTLETTNNISMVIANLNDDDDERGVPADVFELVVNDLGSDTLIPDGLLHADADLVAHLSSINILLRTKPPKPSDMWCRGNGKNEPTQFTYHCQKTVGCPYSSTSRPHMRIHESLCTRRKVRSVICDVEGCNLTFSSQESMKVHKSRTHDFIPRSCEDCEQSVLYESYNAWQNHRKVHSSWEQRKCPVKDCLAQTTFVSARTLERHLRGVHQISDTDRLKEYGCKPIWYTPQTCSFPGCKNVTKYKWKSGLVEHLISTHGVKKDETKNYIILS
jgi:hypothetical protein